MTAAALDRLLAVLVLALAATGLVSLRQGHPASGWLFSAHDLLAGALAIAVAWKLRRSLPGALAAGRWRRLAVAIPVSLLAVAALTGGWLWVASGDIRWVDAGGLGRWTVLTLHAWAGLVLAPLLVLHLLPRRWRLLRPGAGAVPAATRRLVSRRAALTGGALAAGAVALTAATVALERLLGGTRRFTGSRWLPADTIPPATTFFGEPAPPIDPLRWGLRVTAGSTVSELTLGELRALDPVTSRAVLDCTSGWAVETEWRGAPLGAVLSAAGVVADRSVVVRSRTGWSAVVEPGELVTAVLAWEVAGRPLPAGNGAPLRLVLPDRRGLDWVKWVDAIEIA